MHFRLAALALAVAAVAAPPAFAQKSKDTLRIGFYQPVRLVDAFFEPGPEPSLVTDMVFDTLVVYDAEEQKFLPGLAASWKRIDPKTMEFKLREGVKFTDGETVDMDDIEYTYQFMMDPKVNYRFKETRINWIEGFERVDDKTFRIKAETPMAIILAKMANFPSIYPKHIHSKLEQKNSFGLNPVGTGPYRVTEVDPSTGLSLVRNENYKHSNSGKPAGNIGNIRVDPVPDHQTQMARMIRGEQDLMYNVDKDQALVAAKNPDFVVSVQDAVSFTYLMFDVKARSGKKMFTDQRVREALMHAIDRDALRRLVHPAVADKKPLSTVCHPRILHCAWSVEPPKYDPAKAKKLLAEAGYPNGFDLSILTWGEAKDVTEAVAGMWRKVGVNASVNLATFGAFVKTRAAGVPAIVTLWDNSVGQPDIDNTAEYYFMPGSRNYNKDKSLEKMVHAGRAELDFDKRTEIYRKMFDKATEEAYLMALTRIPAVVLHRKEVKLTGGHMNPKGFEINRVAWN